MTTSLVSQYIVQRHYLHRLNLFIESEWIVTVNSIWWVTLRWNPVNTDTNGTCHSVCVNRVSVLSGLILEKTYELLFRFAVPVAGKGRQLAFIEFVYRDLVSTLPCVFWSQLNSSSYRRKMITCSIFFTKRRVESPFRSEMFKHLSKVRMLLNMFDVHVPLIGSVKTSVEELLSKSSELHNNQIMMILMTKFQ